MEHECKRSELTWDETPIINSETVEFKGTCPTCGKVYFQVFHPDDCLWNPETNDWVNLR
jgi:hypothetical protein